MLSGENFYPKCPECNTNIYVDISQVEQFVCHNCSTHWTPAKWNGFKQLSSEERKAHLLINIGEYLPRRVAKGREGNNMYWKTQAKNALDKLSE